MTEQDEKFIQHRHALAAKLQKEAHHFIDDIEERRGKIDHEAALNVWLFRQLATLQLQIEAIGEYLSKTEQ